LQNLSAQKITGVLCAFIYATASCEEQDKSKLINYKSSILLHSKIAIHNSCAVYLENLIKIYCKMKWMMPKNFRDDMGTHCLNSPVTPVSTRKEMVAG